MNKKLLGGIAAVAFAAIIGMNVKMSNSQDSKMTDVSLANVEALAEEHCDSGGEGASFCSIKASVDVPITGGGSSVECSVSCNSSYFACCNFNSGCSCIRIQN